ncbi:MAG TPA: inorganic phosphate transporter [Desulfobacteraceae bacterium]|mgnify:CR=1 FL=1|nr:inorganic phosphate transporter [Desulfobacteraceae bacterium]
MLSFFSAIFLGWSLGANDASNIFGTAVASRMIKFWTAAMLASIFVLLGAILEGQAGIRTLQGLTHLNIEQAVACSLSAAATVTIMTLFGLPVSTSQAVVGAIIGIGFLNRQINLAGLEKVVLCWIGTPVGGGIISIIVYKVLATFYNRITINLVQTDILLRSALLAAGSYGAYALGANNVANVTAVFVDAGQLDVFTATLLGGLSIAFGILTLSRGVMQTVGKRLVKLDAFSALVVILAEAITVHLYTLIGVPVSTSQAVVGAVLGIGIIRGIRSVKGRTLLNIILAWSLTPAVASFIAIAIDFVIHLQYVPGV